MSGRRRRPGQSRAGIVALAAAAVVAVVLLILVIRMAMAALNLTRSDGSEAVDPQFAEPAKAVTRPPEMAGEGAPAPVADDPSAAWEQVELTPVDKTADELGREEAAED